MSYLSDIKFIKVDPTSLERHKLESLLDLYSEYIDFRDNPLPKFSTQYHEKWICTPKYGETDQLYYIAENLINGIVGLGILKLNTGINNKDLAFMYFFVEKQYRRKGIAKNLLKLIYNDIPEVVTKITIYYRPKIFEGNKKLISENHQLKLFLIEKGGKKVFTERRSISNIKSFDIEETIKKAKELKEKVEKLGYEFIFVDGRVKEHPKLNFKEYVSMAERISNDMPKEDGTWNDSIFSPELYDSIQKHFLFLGHYVWTIVLIHTRSSLPIGLTQTWFHLESPSLAFQSDTGVLNEHRGNGFGLALKFQMLAKILKEKSTQEVKYWQTSNAFSNIHMIKINNELKHEEKILFHEFEFQKEGVKNYLSK